MSHLLATRYTVREDFGISKSLEKLDSLEKKIKDEKTQIEIKEKGKKKIIKKSWNHLEINWEVMLTNIKLKSKM